MKKEDRKKSFRAFFAFGSLVRWGLLLAVMLVFTLILYPNLIVKKHSYELGDVADRDIKAPRDFSIVDEKATNSERRQTAQTVLTVYDRDNKLLSKLNHRISLSFDEMRNIFGDEEESRRGSSVSGDSENKALQEEKVSTETARKKISEHERVQQTRERFEKKIGISVSEEDFTLLKKEGFSKKIEELIIQILAEILENGVVANKELLLRESDSGIVMRELGTKTEHVIQKLKKFHGHEQSKEMVRIVAKPLIGDVSKSLVPLIVDFSQRLIQPNITLNRSETEERKKKAAAKVSPILRKIKSGEMILREGEIATEIQVRKLNALNTHKKKERKYARAVGAMGMVLCLLIITYVLHSNPQRKAASRHNRDLLFIATILVIFLLLPKIAFILFESLAQSRAFSISSASMTFGIPLAASTMTICIFLGIDMAIPFAMIISVCTAIIFQNRFEIFLYFLLNSTMGAYWMQDCRERKVFINAGVKLGFLNIILATITDFYIGNYGGSRLLWDWTFAFMGGVSAGIITAGLAPLLEIAFGYTTYITLYELANLERPILRRLMIEAPGTYHHSVVVGSMVEAAAAEIGANSLLAKVCGYYHDIGKIKKPLYFIENQTDGKNRHDKLAPSMSALILISHTRDGVEMGRKNKLGQDIIDTIQQHHGTSTIRFFYEKAKQLRGEDAVNIENFKYPGPKPQTREAGLVMLADVVEAASRTLENPTPSRIQGHVQKLINGIFSDGQLDNCELTLKDLHNIAKSFNTILNGIHHHRVEYPEKSGSGSEKKEKAGHSDKQQIKQARDASEKNQEDKATHLKRLGVSKSDGIARKERREKKEKDGHSDKQQTKWAKGGAGRNKQDNSGHLK